MLHGGSPQLGRWAITTGNKKPGKKLVFCRVVVALVQ